MPSFRRYAIYYAPRRGTPLARFGSSWLGYDAEKGRARTQPETAAVSRQTLREITAQPARYGFHATLKAPFRLAEGCTSRDLLVAVKDLARDRHPVELPALELARLNGFFALVPKAPDDGLQSFAQTCVETLDSFRAPLTEEECERRRATELSERQLGLLKAWGYPYVAEEFRFHLTLTSRLEDEMADRLEPELARHVEKFLPGPKWIKDLCIFGESDADQRFRLLTRVPLARPG